MCIITIKPAGKKISNNVLRKQWLMNSDGAGLMYVKAGKVHYQKGLMTLDALKSALMKLTAYEVAIHLRYATHGAVNTAMTHPFVCNGKTEEPLKGKTDRMVFMHNGMLKAFGDKVESDSFQLAKDILSHIDVASAVALLDNFNDKFVIAHPNAGLVTCGGIFSRCQLTGNEYSNLHWNITPVVKGSLKDTKAVLDLANASWNQAENNWDDWTSESLPSPVKWRTYDDSDDDNDEGYN